MKTILCAAVLVVASTGLASAASEPSNSTNQHHVDSHSFYDNVPDTRMLFGGADASAYRAPNASGHSHPIVR